MGPLPVMYVFYHDSKRFCNLSHVFKHMSLWGAVHIQNISPIITHALGDDMQRSCPA